MSDNKIVRFVVLTTQRTGSTWVLDRLNSVTGIEGHGELFLGHPRRSRGSACCNEYPRFVETEFSGAFGFRPISTFRYLGGLYQRDPCCGFKLMYSHLRTFPEILAYVVLKRVRVVHLVRENHLDVLLSAALANATGRSHITASSKDDGKRKVDLNIKRLIPSIQHLEKNQRTVRRLLSSLPVEKLEMSYESLLRDEDGFREVLVYLEKEAARVEQGVSVLVKRQIRPRSEAIRNYDEVASLLRGSKWERLLD